MLHTHSATSFEPVLEEPSIPKWNLWRPTKNIQKTCQVCRPLCTCLWRTYFIFYSLEAHIITWAVSETNLSRHHKQGHSHHQGRPYGSNDRQGVLERWSKFNLGRNRKMMMWWKLDSEKSLNSKNTLANSLGYFLYSVWLWPNLKCFNVRHCPIQYILKQSYQSFYLPLRYCVPILTNVHGPKLCSHWQILLISSKCHSNEKQCSN